MTTEHVLTTLTKEEFLDLEGEFTWGFGMEFLIYTSKGMFTWNDPSYGGDNVVRPFIHTGSKRSGHKQWTERVGIPYGRDKGRRTVRNYTGDRITFLTT